MVQILGGALWVKIFTCWNVNYFHQICIHMLINDRLGGLTTLHAGKHLTIFCLLLIFFLQDYTFSKNISGIPSEFQTVCIQIRPECRAWSGSKLFSKAISRWHQQVKSWESTNIDIWKCRLHGKRQTPAIYLQINQTRWTRDLENQESMNEL